MEIKDTCKQQRTVDYVTQIAALLAEMPRTAWEDVLDYIYIIKWWEIKEEVIK
jgi:hypothetical protein